MWKVARDPYTVPQPLNRAYETWAHSIVRRGERMEDQSCARVRGHHIILRGMIIIRERGEIGVERGRGEGREGELFNHS